MNERNTRRFQRRSYDTRLDRFLRTQDVDLDGLAAAIGMTRQNLNRVRAGKQNPRQDTIARFVLAMRHALGRGVAASELFYLGEEQDDDTPEAKEFLRNVA